MMRLVVIGTLFLYSGPSLAQNAADQFYDPTAMAEARAALKASHGSQYDYLVLGERLEYQSNEGDALIVWEAQAWVGSDLKKLWIKTEGEYETDDGRFEEAEVQALYSIAVSPFWDLQAGIRYDIEPDPSRVYGVVGIQGLAPYWFEIDGQLFLSEEGDLSARVEAEYELRFSQRWILQPRIELNAAFSDDAEIGVSAGLSSAAAGLRLRYEISREVAPYVGVSWNRFLGESADSEQLSWVAGLRFWF